MFFILIFCSRLIIRRNLKRKTKNIVATLGTFILQELSYRDITPILLSLMEAEAVEAEAEAEAVDQVAASTSLVLHSMT